MKDVDLPAVEIIGYEGLWGVLMMVVVVYPTLWFLPGPDHGHAEDIVDTLTLVKNSHLSKSPGKAKLSLKVRGDSQELYAQKGVSACKVKHYCVS